MGTDYSVHARTCCEGVGAALWPLGTEESVPILNREFTLHRGGRGKTERLANVLHLEVGVAGQNLGFAHTTGEHAKHRRHGDAQPPDTGDTAHLIRIYRDALEVRRLHIWLLFHYRKA